MLKKFENGLVKINQIVLGLMVFVMFLLVFTNVITRYIFSYSINWAEELSRYLMVWTAFLGAGLAMREGQHVAIEILHEYLPKSFRKYFKAFIGLLIIGFLGILAYLGFQYALVSMEQNSAVLRWSMGMIYMAVPIGAILFIIHLVLVFKEYMHRESIEDLMEENAVSDKVIYEEVRGKEA
jgi:TRAP-type C4-dicarboxylate transport system permease small subunit